MSEMLDRVAKAIIDAGYNPATAADIARISIEAMREPTEDMANEAECAEPFSFEAMWKAAIDAALSQGKD